MANETPLTPERLQDEIRAVRSAVKTHAGTIGVEHGVEKFIAFVESALHAAARVEQEIYEPNVWICETCGFQLNKMVLRASDGAVGIDKSDVQDICPNDGTSMRRRTWKEACDVAVKNAIRFMDERADLESQLRTTTEALEQVRQERDQLREPCYCCREQGAPARVCQNGCRCCPIEGRTEDRDDNA